MDKTLLKKTTVKTSNQEPVQLPELPVLNIERNLAKFSSFIFTPGT